MPDPKPSRSALWGLLIGIVTGLLARRPGPALDPEQGQGQDRSGAGAADERIARLESQVDKLQRESIPMWLKRAALIGEAVLLIQLPLFAWQVYRQDRDTTIVRRAQLLATIYDCADPDWEPESVGGPEICPPKAHPRARAEAVVALAEIDGEGLSLASAALSGLRLTGANLRGAYLSRADLTGANLSGTDLSQADLKGANLRGTDLSQANLSRTDLSQAELRGADLTGANLAFANLAFADLAGAGLASLTSPASPGSFEVNLSEADLRFSDLKGANLSGTDLSQARYLHQVQINSANGNDKTRLPEGLTHSDRWLEAALYPGFTSRAD